MTSKRGQSGYSNSIVRAVTVIAIAVLFVVPGLTAAATRGKANAEQAKIPFPRPQSHAANWLEYHGRAVTPAMNADGSIGNNCQTCHEKTDCVSCHMTTPPRDHTNTWRSVSHGFMAEGNRDRCQTCHKQDFCVRCHNETAPRSHVGAWRRGHCTWCHYGSGFTPADNCVVCHRKAGHTSAPHSVDPRADCSLCHH